MSNFKKILLPTDMSENSRAAIPHAVELARKFNGTVHLLHVFEDDIYYANMAGNEMVLPEFAMWMQEAYDKRELESQALAGVLAATERVPVERVMRRGNPAKQIIEYANEIKADCIVLATHGRTGLSRLMFGSVAEKVVRLSPCPVLTVRPQTVKEGVPAKAAEPAAAAH